MKITALESWQIMKAVKDLPEECRMATDLLLQAHPVPAKPKAIMYYYGAKYEQNQLPTFVSFIWNMRRINAAIEDLGFCITATNGSINGEYNIAKINPYL